jgi:hypothetical protein
MKPRIRQYPTVDQIRSVIRRFRVKQIEKLLDDSQLGTNSNGIERACDLLLSLVKKGEARVIPLGDHPYYDAMAFSLPQFEDIACEALEIALDATRQC